MDHAHPVPLSGDPQAAGRLMRMASIASMSVATLLIVGKAAAWLATDSVAMLSSLIDSSLDLLSSMITFLAIRQALQPADAEHRFGHGKAEALAGAKVGRLHIVGGGSKNAVLNQLAANACGIPALAGPAEATVIGNILVQV